MKLANGKVTLHAGDCLEVLATLAENSIDAVVTDPPYHFTSIVKRFGKEGSAPAQYGTDGAFARASRGFMGKEWDGGDIAFRPETWALVWRVLKPGGHLVAFGAPKNYHRLACAIEDAGFEIRDSLMWVTGQGFPKSHNIGCKCDGDAIPYTHERAKQTPECDLRRMRNADVSQAKFAGEKREEILLNSLQEQGLHSPERKPSPKSSVWGEEPCMEGRSDISASTRELCDGEIRKVPKTFIGNGQIGRICDGTSLGNGDENWSNFDKNGMRSSSGSQSTKQPHIKSGVVAGQSQPQTNGTREVCSKCGQPLGYKGFGTSLKPAYEPVVLARKPLSEGTVAANVLRWGTGALNIDATRVGTESTKRTTYKIMSSKGARGGAFSNQNHEYELRQEAAEFGSSSGRWPANFCHDGSQEVLDLFPHTKSGTPGIMRKGRNDGAAYGAESRAPGTQMSGFGDEGSAARFFYCAKASKHDRAGSKHPTVKPVSLMRWLVRMVTPPGGTVLDPFAGSGTTGLAAVLEGFDAQLIEREAEYQADIQRRFDD